MIRLSRIKAALERAPGPLRPVAEWILEQRREYNRIYLYCFEPSRQDQRSVTGQIVVRGSCFTQRPDDEVEVLAGDLPALRVRPVLNRRDDRLPNVCTAQTGHSDFTVRFDTAPLANGPQFLKLKLISSGKAVRRVSAKINVDHERGIASEYDRWIQDFEIPSRDALAVELPDFHYRPRFAVLSGDPQAAGVQSYTNYELGTAVDIGNVDYVCWLGNGLKLLPDALAFVVQALNTDREIDLLYGDDDRLDADGRRRDPFFKPAWSPDLALSFNYLGGFIVLRSALFLKLEFKDGYDLVLKAAGRAKSIRRVSHVLSHRGADQSSLAPGAPFTHFEPGRLPGTWRARYSLAAATSLSIIVGSGGAVEVLDTNLRSLFALNRFRNFELLVNDNSRSEAIREYLDREWKHERRIRWLDSRVQPFNYAVLNNTAASQCRSDVLLFLNDDTSAGEPDWIEAMLELAVRPEVGAVGAKLLYPNGLIQHAGVVMGIFDNCGHAFKGLNGQAPHYFGLSDTIRNVSAVTAACLMTRREVFEQVGGFDAKTFAVAFNDVDLCLEIGRAGYRVLYTPFAVLYHHEAFSKPAGDLVPATAEVAAMRGKWAHVIADDPFYSPNLTRRSEDYSLRNKLPSVPGSEL